MAKKRKKEQNSFDAEGPVHKPKKEHAHIAREFSDLNQPDLRDEMTRHMMPWAQNAALGKQ